MALNAYIRIEESLTFKVKSYEKKKNNRKS